MRLKGKAAIVTGAASGIGHATAQLFASEGAQVLAVDLPGKNLAVSHSGHERIEVLEKSVADADSPEAIVDGAAAKFGRLDIIMNNAGVSGRHFAEEMPLADWDRTFEINIRSVFRLCQRAIPHLKAAGGGRIINVASVMAEGTDLGLSAYCASKAGVAGLTRTLALELGKFGITANYLLPGAIYTGMTRPLWDQRPDIAEIWAKKSPLKRLGQPIDLARAALFLASEESGFITGHGLNVDGGLMLRV